MSQEVIITRGLPGSGKSTFSKKMVAENPEKYKRLNLDDLRATLDNGHKSKYNEKFVKRMRDLLLMETLKEGKSVISDNLHLSDKSVNHIKQLVEKFNKENNKQVEVKIQSFLDVPLEVCIKRDMERSNSVGEKFIRQMYDQFVSDEMELLCQNPDLEKIILCDIDGTIADHQGKRSPYDWSKVGQDAPKHHVINIIKVLSTSYKVIFFSGRSSVCRHETIDWIFKYFGWSQNGYELYMREERDNRKDSIIKRELFDKYIRNKYYVEAVFDDRLQVCRAWHEMGLQLLRVGNPDADF